MAELPPHDPSTQAGAHARAPATPPSSVRPGASGERLPEGTQLGHFTIRRLIGTGGMGRVYQAQQESPRRAVAIKVMNQGLGSATALRRFEFEAQVLARLKHPGIAQIHEAGSHDFGDGSVPWFAMEYIANAKPVTDYALDAKLGLRERLKLFRQACEAVAHGHQRGVIHRDLKPSNLLVDGAGLLKVIDFGVARSTDSDMAAATLQTDVGQLVGTVQYMSPEQFDADPNDLDIRSDVYALGVVLYELLAGRLPYDLRKKPIHEAARIVREEDAPRIASLPTELHIVLNKALAKDRTQRYGSAAELSQDIERWLDGEPIAARAPGLIASVRRLVRRHRALSAAVASAFVVMAVALTALVQQNRELQREKTAAIEARAEAEQKTKAAEDALAAKRQAEDSASQDRRAKLAEAYAASIVRGLASLSEGDGEGVQAALAAVTTLRKEGLADPSPRIEMRLLKAAPAAEVREVELGAGRPISIDRDPTSACAIVLAERGIVLADAGDLATQLPLGVAGANAAAFRPDGQRLAVGTNDGTVLLVQAPPKRADGSQDWKAAFSVARRLAGHTAAVRAVAWSADGTRLASGDAAGAVRVWDGADGAPVRTIVTGDRACRALLFGREGAWLLAATADNRLQRWNLATGAALAPAVDLGRPVATIATDEAAGVLAIAFEDASVETWDAAKTMRTASTRASAVPRALAIGASKIVAATEAGAETLDASGGKPVRVPGLPKDCVALQLDGGTVLAASARGGLLAAPLEAARTTEAFATACTRLASACMLPGLAPLVALAGDGSPVEIWDTLTATRLATLQTGGAAPKLVARSDDGRLVAGAGKDGGVHLWNAITGERLPALKSDGTPVHALAFAPSGRMLVAGDRAGRILRWELPSGTPLAPVGDGAAITSLAFRPSEGDPLLATGSTDGTVSLRDPQSGQIVRELPGGPATDLAGNPVEVRALAFSPDGRTLAAALATGSLRLWSGTDGDASNATLGAPIEAHRDSITSLAFDPVGGSTLVTASTDGSVRLWAVGAGARELAKLEPGIGPIAAVVIDGDASTLVCAGTGGRVALWRTQGPLALSKSRAAVTNALDARRTAVQDWYSKGGPANALAEFDRVRAGLDPSQVHALRDLMLRFGPCGAK